MSGASSSPRWWLIVCFASVGLGVSAVGSGCTDTAYVEGRCEDTAGCSTELNNIPGSTCIDNKCECKSGEDACCPDGDPAKCKAIGDYACRPEFECHPELMPPPDECTTASDCQIKPADPRCAEPTCEDGKCSMGSNLLMGAIASQVDGDCKVNYCNSDGEVYEVDAPSDKPVDGEACTIDVCDGEKNQPILWANGSPCPGTNNGVCLDGACVECLDNTNCKTPSAPVCDAGLVCVPWSCVDGAKNGMESDYDCGGLDCKPCNPGWICKVNDDCRSRVCAGGKCQAATHTDAVKNDGETGVDCGCAECTLKCKDGEGCKTASDCMSGVCYGGTCHKPTCTDGTQNGGEGGPDCGGACALLCFK